MTVGSEQTSTSEWARVVEAAPSAMLVVDRSHSIVLANRRAEILFGYRRSELVGARLESIVPPRKGATHTEPRGLFAGGEEVSGLRKDGSEVSIELSLGAVEVGREIFTLASVVDVTDRMREGARFRLVVDAAPNAMLMVDARGTIALVNKKAEELFGYRREELLGERVELLVPERLRGEHPAHVARFFSAPRARAMGVGRELYGRRRDGSEVPVEIGLNPIDTTEGIYTLASIIDITERRRAEERFRLAVEAAPNAMVMVDGAGKIALVNKKTELLFGYRREELLGELVEVLVPERVRAVHPTLVRRFSAEPEVRAMGAGRDLFARRRDGSELPVEIGLNPIETADGSFTLASIVDTSERVMAEEKFRRVVEAAPSAMIVVDGSGTITLVNQKTEDLFRYSRNELVGSPVERLVPERFRGRHPDHVARYFGEPSVRAMGAGRELFGLRADGVEVPIEIGLSPLRTSEGAYTLASIIDISERKSAEGASQRLAAIVESSDDAIVSTSLDGRVTSWNGGAERLYGYTGEESLGRAATFVVPERLVSEEARLKAKREQRAQFDTQRRRKDGTEIDVSVRISPIRDAEGNVVGESEIARDIGEIKRRDAELKRSNAELEQFAYVASHDLQEPLRMVANYTELLAERYADKLDDRAKKYIFYASDGAVRMQRLVADLLAYSRVGSQGKRLQPVDANVVLKRVVEALAQKIRDAGAEVVHDVLPVVEADETQLGQVLQNLVGNALKFRGESAPRVVVGAVQRDGFWELTVADNGIGMDMQYASRIFQMFQRLHALGRYEGSGIGLAIAKRIVERHGGTIWVESSPGAGSTFHFTIPARRST